MTVHVLLHGRSYCNMDNVPAMWPEGHKWVRVADYKDANCKGCLALLFGQNSVRCHRCEAPLVDGHGRLIADSRSASEGPRCFPRCWPTTQEEEPANA